MIKRFLPLSAVLLLLAVFFASTAETASNANVKRAKTNQLVAMLPASDTVVTMDVKRFFAESLPTIFSSNQPMLADINAKLALMQQKTGIDPRRFDLIVAGSNIAVEANNSYKLSPVAIARGGVESSDLIASAKTASQNKYKQEDVNGKTMYVFSLKDIAELAKANAKDADDNAKIDRSASKMALMLENELAIAAIDSNTVAFGLASRVRETLEHRSKVASEITNMLNRKEFATVNFAGKMPAGVGLGKLIPLESDEFGKSLDSIKFVYGNLDSTAGQASMDITAKTSEAAQAEQLHDTLDVLQTFGKMALGSSKRPDQQLYARMIDKVKFSRTGSEVSMNLVLPQSDIDELMSILTKKKK